MVDNGDATIDGHRRVLGLITSADPACPNLIPLDGDDWPAGNINVGYQPADLCAGYLADS